MFKQKLLKLIKEKKLTVFDEKKLEALLNIRNKADKATLKQTISELIAGGEIVSAQKGKLMLPDKTLVKGELRGHAKGYGFVVPSDNSEDIFIPAKDMNGALNKDTVWARILKKSVKGNEGEIVSIIKRGNITVVGTAIKPAGKRHCFVKPDENKLGKDIFIVGGEQVNDGDKVVVRLIHFGSKEKSPEGVIIENLGRSGEYGTDLLSVIRSHNFKTEFSEGALEFANKVRPRDIVRRDTRNQLVITIDGEDAKDFDDAVSVTKNEKGYLLSVHIADVGEFVPMNSPLDREALGRSTSVYYPGGVIPMLPEVLSNGECSLVQGEDRLALSVDMQINKNGTVTEFDIYQSVIRSKGRLTYTEATAILMQNAERITQNGGYTRGANIDNMLQIMKELAAILKKKRTARGNIDFETTEAKFKLDEKGHIISIIPYDYSVSNGIIEEFMLITNETVAEYMARGKYPFVYRVHEEPSDEKIQAFKIFLEGCGIMLNAQRTMHNGGIKNIKNEEFRLKIAKEDASKSPLLLQNILNEVKGTPLFPVVNRVMLRTMMKAKYSIHCSGHYGLAAPYYCHFTSPIRRYPDLCIHRIIKMLLEGKLDNKAVERLIPLTEKTAEISSERERAAELAERDIEDILKAKYCAEHIGEKHKGVVSGITAFGIFVELDNTIEGMVRIEDLPQDRYTHNEARYTLTGTKNSYRIGQEVTIEIIGVEGDKVRFGVYNKNNENNSRQQKSVL